MLNILFVLLCGNLVIRGSTAQPPYQSYRGQIVNSHSVSYGAWLLFICSSIYYFTSDGIELIYIVDHF